MSLHLTFAMEDKILRLEAKRGVISGDFKSRAPLFWLNKQLADEGNSHEGDVEIIHVNQNAR